jgi:hypothetical protein
MNKNLTKSEAGALASFVQNVLQSFAVGGDKLTGAALVAAIDPKDMDPALAAGYLSLCAKEEPCSSLSPV